MIIIFSNYDDINNPFYGGGGAQAIHQIARRLIPYFEIVIFTGTYPHSRNETVDGIKYRRLGTHLFGPYVGQLIFQILLPFYAIYCRYDLWIESFTPPFSTACLQLFTRKPVIALVHMLSGKDMFRKYRIPFHWIEQIGLKTYRYFIVLTKSMKKYVESVNLSALVWVIPNGVTIHSSKMKFSSTEKFIVYIGRIEVNQKGLDLLLSEYQKNKDRIGYRIKIAGSGTPSEMKKLRTLITNYNLEDQVELVGKVNGDSKEMLFHQAICVVLPSRFESFSLAALETIAHGVPLIVFDIPNLEWIPKDCAVKVPAFDPQKLTEAICSVCQNKLTRIKLSQKSLEISQFYSWENAAQRYKESIRFVSRKYSYAN